MKKKTTVLTETIWSRVRQAASTEIRAFVKAWLVYQKLWADLDAKFLLPHAAKKQILAMEQTDASHLTPDQLVARAAELSALRRINENESVQGEARRGLINVFCAMRQPMDELSKAVEKSFAEQIAELTEAEKAFFCQFGLNHEQTSVVRTALALRNSFAGKVEHYHTVCRNTTSQPTGGSFPQLDLETFACLFEPAK